MITNYQKHGTFEFTSSINNIRFSTNFKKIHLKSYMLVLAFFDCKQNIRYGKECFGARHRFGDDQRWIRW